MAKKIVWTNYLKDEAIYRYWYVLENNNFKKAIKHHKTDKDMTCANMHNALYSGLYYPQEGFNFQDRTVLRLRKERGIPYNRPIANFMSRDEILMNIHAMNDAAYSLRTLSKFGYNSKLFASEFYNLGKEENERRIKMKIKPKALYPHVGKKEERELNKPNRYNLARKLLKSLKKEGYTPQFTTVSKRENKELFKKALNNYLKAKFVFENTIKTIGIYQLEKKAMLKEQLDSGFYRSVIPHYGFSIDNILFTDHLEQVITAKELNIHAKKFEAATKALTENKELSYKELLTVMYKTGKAVRNEYIEKNHTYPEIGKGFKNAFCEMISHQLSLNPQVFEDKEKINVNDFSSKLIHAILRLKSVYNESKNEQEKQEIKVQLEKFRQALENSNKETTPEVKDKKGESQQNK